ncbi:hypothetical protein GGH95_002904 [Coemansia sp. RSA 1836]|nr:hypothetical protein GGH95_002904 [Coemansia sp. RSA 1836]
MPKPTFLCGECPWTGDDVDEFIEHRKGHHPARFAPPPEQPPGGYRARPIGRPPPTYTR